MLSHSDIIFWTHAHAIGTSKEALSHNPEGQKYCLIARQVEFQLILDRLSFVTIHYFRSCLHIGAFNIQCQLEPFRTFVFHLPRQVEGPIGIANCLSSEFSRNFGAEIQLAIMSQGRPLRIYQENVIKCTCHRCIYESRSRNV